MICVIYCTYLKRNYCNFAITILLLQLYKSLIIRQVLIEDMWVDDVIGGSWVFTWRRRLFVWEENLLNALLGDLDGFIRNNMEDVWRWKLGGEDVFTVKSLYLKLEEERRVEGSISEGERNVF